MEKNTFFSFLPLCCSPSPMVLLLIACWVVRKHQAWFTFNIIARHVCYVHNVQLGKVRNTNKYSALVGTEDPNLIHNEVSFT
ncbi:hypothetical protein [Prevotella histicola]|uniref:hypothetical protein n=1 Tax=Prevotella histicola TaxID=470565 RepID=UPI003C751B75